VKLGVGHERQCALGALTKKRLESVGLCEAIMKNVKVQSPTGDFLVNQLRVGALDAVIAYASNATGFSDIEGIRLEEELQFAVQPIAVARESKHRRMAERLQAAILSAQSAERFKNAGFKWNVTPPKPK
jgi:ABC-type molybdate transport system substrate-binding protein